MLKDYLDRYLIEAFGIQDSPLEKALLSTDRRNSVEKELEYRAVLILRFQYLERQQLQRMV